MTNLEALTGSDRAEDLSPEEVVTLFAGAGGDEALVVQLMKPGVFLLQGSRGTGKTMLMRVAYERLRRQAPLSTLPVWVSFSRYLATYNTAVTRRPGYSPFQNWVFAKLLRAIKEAATSIGRYDGGDDIFGVIPLERYTDRLETHFQDPAVADPEKNALALGVTQDDLWQFARLDQLQPKITGFLDQCQLPGVTLFLDEAAQSFAEELQPEFFQLVRHLRHHRISVKAAVYPNTTNYGRDFDVGQDAIILPLERQIENQEGMSLFQELVEKRFGTTELGKSMARSRMQTDFLIKMSGGNPRWFIHLLNRLSFRSGDAITAAQAMAAVKEFPDSTLWPYLRKIRDNLVSKRKYVDAALELSQILIEGLREANRSVRKDGGQDRTTCYVGLSTHKTLPYRVHAAARLLQYAGIIAGRGPKKITGRETAEMYLIHPAILVRENPLFPSESNPSLEAFVRALTEPARERFKEFTRNSPRLLDFRQSDEGDSLLCTVCHTPAPEGARFCMACGQPLEGRSPFEELLGCSSSELELTPGIKQRLIDDGRFPTVGDIVRASDGQIDSIKWIGVQRVTLIRYAVEEFLAG